MAFRSAHIPRVHAVSMQTPATLPASMNGEIVLAFLFFVLPGLLKEEFSGCGKVSAFGISGNILLWFFRGEDFFNFAGGSNMLDGRMNELFQFLENF